MLPPRNGAVFGLTADTLNSWWRAEDGETEKLFLQNVMQKNAKDGIQISALPRGRRQCRA